jgi:YkoY family integral membrane protein
MDWHIVLVILNLVIIESLLSVDNASALAAMVQHLPLKQRLKALRYGLFGAYFFRGLCLFLASWLIKILWLKIAGGLYLLFLAYKHFSANSDGEGTTKTVNKGFWATVVSVEILDLSLSIDNIFAAVALSKEFWVIMVGVAIGILAMRFVAGWFVKLIDKYPSLVNSAFIVIALLGFKLILGGIVDYIPSLVTLKSILESHIFDFAFSTIMMIIFFYPIAFGKKKEPVPVPVETTPPGTPRN